MRFFYYALLIATALPSAAQTRREQLRTMVDSVLQAKYDNTPYDTTFVVRPEGRLMLKVRANMSGNIIRAGGSETSAHLRTSYRRTLSLGANYRGVSAGVAINPSSLSGKNKDYELNVNVYSTRYSVDASYQISKTLEGNIERNGTKYYLPRGMAKMKTLNVTGYYTFNYRRFSYPAAFTQSYIQKRSAGSWLVGFSYQGGSVKPAAGATAGLPDARFYEGHFGIGGGYGYNLTCGSKWLFHLSALPTLVVYSRDNITIDGECHYSHVKFPMVILGERLAVVHNFGPSCFAGLTAVATNSLKRNNSGTDLRQSKWRARVFFGVRL